MKIPKSNHILSMLGNISKADDDFIKKIEDQIARIKAGKTFSEWRTSCCGDKLKEVLSAQNKAK